MTRKATRLRFTKEELASPKVRQAAAKAEKAAELFAQDEFSEAMNKYSVGKKKRKTLE